MAKRDADDHQDSTPPADPRRLRAQDTSRPFSVGDEVVYPNHGIAELKAREVRTVGDDEVVFLVFELPARGWNTHGGMTVAVPEDKTEQVGIRHAASLEDADDVLATVGATNARVPSNWSRRFKNHQEKLKSGDLFQCAEVVRNLAQRQRTSNLAAAEAAMYTTARWLLSSELAVSWGVPVEEAEARIDRAMGIGVDAEATTA